MLNRTIFALSTASGKAGIAIVRISGNEAFSIAEAISGPLPEPRKAFLRNLMYDHMLIDQAIVIRFKKDNSYTGEDMVEFQVHGSNAVLANLFEVFTTKFKLPMAKPGEFTKRALENGRMDLSQVEGLGDLIEAETKQQHKQSLNSLIGSISNKTDEWRQLILEALALTEIMIDFTDQEVPEDTCYEIDRVLRILLKNLHQELGRYKASELVRDGFDITIIGKPNVGKSSLLNYIAGKERAIVSEVAGTTRDIIELSIDLKGYRVNFFDTAGIHETKDSIELIGIDRAKTKAKNSDMRIFLLENNDLVKNFGLEIKSDDLVFNAKSDLFNSTKKAGISGKTGDGVNKMLDIVFQKIKNKTRYNSVLINERHKNIIEITISSLTSAQEELKRTNVQIEIVAELLRSSITQLDLLIGKINVEDILGAIFSSFCIGK